jgi:uncharacterized protein (TIGR02145 family)
MKTTRFLMAATLAFALAFTFNACDSGGGGGGGDKSSSSVVSSSAIGGSSSSSYSSSSEDNTLRCGSKEYDPATQFCDVRDNKIYKWVKIDEQIWIAENLNYETATGSWCNTTAGYGCDTPHGRLYSWATAMGFPSACNVDSIVNCNRRINIPHQGICPSGWHLPSDEEWQQLFDAVGGFAIAAKKLKVTVGWYDGGNGTNDYGFSALPSGRYNVGSYISFYGTSFHCGWWSAHEYDAARAYYRFMNYLNDNTNWGYYDKRYGYSVRCVMDED